jgi:hypothetical protein
VPSSRNLTRYWGSNVMFSSRTSKKSIEHSFSLALNCRWFCPDASLTASIGARGFVGGFAGTSVGRSVQNKHYTHFKYTIVTYANFIIQMRCTSYVYFGYLEQMSLGRIKNHPGVQVQVQISSQNTVQNRSSKAAIEGISHDSQMGNAGDYSDNIVVVLCCVGGCPGVCGHRLSVSTSTLLQDTPSSELTDCCQSHVRRKTSI